MFNSRRWPLIIDPQGQANKWIKNFGKDSNIHITKLTEANFLKILENAIRNGQSVLLENVEEDLDPSLEPVLNKQIVKSATGWTLRLGDSDIPYGKEFKFYLTTKMPNPHYIPEICIKTTIINFTVTPSGLEDQLLAEVVRFERIELETRRVELILQISQDKRQLQDLEDKILRLIGEAQGRILEDETLINTLDASKVTSETVNTRIAQSRTTSLEIDRAREEYRSIARRGSVIYFVISDLAQIDPMYQYSLEFFISLFKRRLEVTPKKEVLAERIALLIDDITESFYVNICRGLFEKDKLLYSFLITTKIQLAANKINPKEWAFYSKGAATDPDVDMAEKPEFLIPETYLNLASLSLLTPSYRILLDEIKSPENAEAWRRILASHSPTSEPIPPNINSRLDYFQKMLLLKVLRPEALISMIKYYIENTLGKLFIESPVFDLKGSYADSGCTTPLIFVLSPGADPISYLLSLAKENEMDGRLKMLSLGQGQGDIAKELIKTGRRNGDWVCLQNCHLAISWMTELERIQENQVFADTHADYRLWLTSMPTSKFPVPVLQSGIKLTNEPPKGLKANLNRTYNEVTETVHNSCSKPFEFKKLLFSLAFFHACILERRKYGAIGWNISYEWMNSDFETCLLQLRMYLDEQAEIPYTTLKYLIAEINYGGRVTDDKDSRLINALLNKYFDPKLMEGRFNFEPQGVYHSPEDLDLGAIRAQIQALPLDENPEVYGLHTNASITFHQKNVREFMETLLSVQPRGASTGGGGESANELGERIAKEIEARIPEPIALKKIDSPVSLDIFRMQEVDRFNKLIRVIKKSLVDLQKAIKGTVVMSLELEDMFNAFLLKKVPENWEKHAYLSLKPLQSWVADLIERINFYKKWVDMGYCSSYWISSFFFPQGFMTASLQTYARKNMIPIDTLIFRSNVTNFYPDNIQKIPESGVNIHGLFAEGCGCDVNSGRLVESRDKELFFEMPVIWLEPITLEHELKGKTIYKCPIYKTSTRKGTLSTTGHSTNFVMYMDFHSDVSPDHWIRRGVALLCQLDN
jgi:dynein heavy chain